ncbi:MAG: hypothetical protein AAFQ68_20655 [Bacteroidota bacterium]
MPAFIRFTVLLTCLCLLSLGISCGPKKIEAKAKSPEAFAQNESSFDWPGTEQSEPSPASFRDMVHRVKVEEQLPAERYVYLRVSEKGQSFWIATRKAPIETGATYFYRDGLLKTQFYSKEYDRTFDRIFLVSKLVPEKHGGNALSAPQTGHTAEATASPNDESVRPKAKTSDKLRIADLLANPKAYDGQIVEISGQCVKVNPNIMKRNWLHLKDGSADNFDLVVTTQQAVSAGDQVNIRAKVVLNKDFGAGYQYDLILEDGVLIN